MQNPERSPGESERQSPTRSGNGRGADRSSTAVPGGLDSGRAVPLHPRPPLLSSVGSSTASVLLSVGSITLSVDGSGSIGGYPGKQRARASVVSSSSTAKEPSGPHAKRRAKRGSEGAGPKRRGTRSEGHATEAAARGQTARRRRRPGSRRRAAASCRAPHRGAVPPSEGTERRGPAGGDESRTNRATDSACECE